MAIADHIGYDAAGRDVPKDDLKNIFSENLNFRLNPSAYKRKHSNIFTVPSNLIERKRIDPLFYSQEVFQIVEGKPYARLADVTEYMKSGFAAGKQGQELTNLSDAVIQIRPTNLGEEGQLKFDKNIYINKAILESRTRDTLQKGEVLFNNTNSQELVGKTAFFDLNGIYCCSNHITRIKANAEKLDPRYLTLILNAYQQGRVFYNICTNWNNQSGVNTELLADIPIPLPSLAIQERIADKVQQRMERAQALKREASEELEAIKLQMKEVILGKAE